MATDWFALGADADDGALDLGVYPDEDEALATEAMRTADRLAGLTVAAVGIILWTAVFAWWLA